jgi:predicted peptidase
MHHYKANRRDVEFNLFEFLARRYGEATWAARLDALCHIEAECLAAVPIAGDLHWESVRALTQFPIWAFHGADDRLVRPDAIRRVARWMGENGGVLRYTEFPGVGHGSWDPALSTPGLLDFLTK